MCKCCVFQFQFQIPCSCIVDGFRDLIKKNANYICKLKSNLVELQRSKNRLVAARRTVESRVDLAAEQGKRQLEGVRECLKRVTDAEVEVDQLLGKGSDLEQKCGGFCYIFNYKLGKKVARKLTDVSNLQEEVGKIDQVAEQLPEGRVVQRPTVQEFVGRQSLFDEIRQCIVGNQVRIIGLKGMGGVGKTTLLFRINNSFVDNMDGFDVVILVEVRNFERPEAKIQAEIGRKFGLYNETWENKSEEKKAIDILRVLEREKFLLLLDNIWQGIDFERVGVSNLLQNGAVSKVVFTTRSEAVCRQMRPLKEFKVECLTTEEAWVLFESNVGDVALESDPAILIDGLARNVAFECDGLPLALKIVGQAMSNMRSKKRWQDAVDVLRRSAYDFSNGQMIRVLQHLKFSYDHLHEETACRSCFLYCCLFAERYSISKRDLIDYCISEDFLRGGINEQHFHNNVIKDLIRACLLEEVDDDHVKLHNVVRDMAIWVAHVFEAEKGFVVRAGIKPTEASQTLQGQQEAKRISVMESQIENLPYNPQCPYLHTLFLNSNSLRNIGGDFFRSMPILKVLNLSNNRDLTELPEEISKLFYLRHLDLSHTSIEKLSITLKLLKNLKCLNLEHTLQLHTIPKLLISCFPMLRILRMLNCGSDRASDDSLLSDHGVSLVEELGSLALERLSINLTSAEALQTFLNSHELLEHTQHLHLRFLNGLKAPEMLVTKIQNLNTLNISDCKHLEELKISYPGVGVVHQAFYSLQEVTIRSCSRLSDLTWLILAPSIKRLLVSSCSDVKEIISVSKSVDFPNIVVNRSLFKSLERLELQQLPKLESIYQRALTLPNLKKIEVDRCRKLMKLPLDYNSLKERNFVIQGQKDWWKSLKWEDQETKVAFSNCFKNLKM